MKCVNCGQLVGDNDLCQSCMDKIVTGDKDIICMFNYKKAKKNCITELNKLNKKNIKSFSVNRV